MIRWHVVIRLVGSMFSLVSVLVVLEISSVWFVFDVWVMYWRCSIGCISVMLVLVR